MSDPDASRAASADEAAASVRAAKRELRAAMIARRASVDAELGPAGRAAAAAAAAVTVRGRIRLDRDWVVSGYWPLSGEFDCRPLLQALHAEGHRIGLPVVAAKRTPLVFRQWAPGAPLVPGPFELLQPPEEAAELRPDMLLVPLLAVDRDGYRLGYGAGFYDRTLAALRARGPRPLAVGIAYEAQRVEAVPREPTDEPLDWLVTEAGAARFGRGEG